MLVGVRGKTLSVLRSVVGVCFFYDGEALVNQTLDPVKFFRSRTAVQSLRVILQEADIMEEYKPNFPKY